MKIKEVSCAKGRTVSMGDYEFVRFDVSVKARLDKGDDPEESYNELSEFVDNRLDEEVEQLQEEE